MKKISIFLILLVSILEISCSGPLIIKGNRNLVKKMQNIALVEFVHLPISKPGIPLIDAAVFNSDLEEVAPLMIDFDKKIVDSMQTYFVNKYEEYGSVKLIYGEELKNNSKYQELLKDFKTYDRSNKDEDFPLVAIPKNNLNFIDFNNFDDLIFYNFNDDILKTKFSRICKTLNVESVCIVLNGVRCKGPFGFILSPIGLFLKSWYKINRTRILYFNNENNIILQMSMDGQKYKGDGDDFDSYQNSVLAYFKNVDYMLKVLFDLKKRKEEKTPGKK